MTSSGQTGGLLSLKANFSWTFFGNAFYAACKWINVLVLAKLATTDILGRYALGLAVSAPIMMLTDLQLRTVQATDARRDFAFATYLRLRLVGILLGLSGVSVVALTIYPDSGAAVIIAAVALVKAAESLADVFYGLFQQRERMDRVARSLIVKGILSTAAFAAMFYETGRLFPSVLAIAASYLLVFAILDLPAVVRILRDDRADAKKEASEPDDPGRLSSLAKLTLPMGVAMALSSLYVNVPRYAVEHFHGTGALGIFSALAYLVALASLFVSSLGQAVSPRLSQYFASNNFDAFRSLLRRVLAIVMALGLSGILVAAVFGESLLAALYNEAYARESSLFVWLMLVTALSMCGNIFGAAVTAMRLFRVQAIAHTIGVILISALSFALVDRHGLQGAAWAMLATTAVMVCVYASLVRRGLRAAVETRPQ